MTAHEWLLQIRHLDRMICAKCAEKERIYELATDIVGRPPDGMPAARGSSSDRVSDAAVRLYAADEEIGRIVKKYMRKKEDIMRVIERLPADEYFVAHMHYVCGATFESIAEKMDKSVMQVYRIRKAALRRIEDMVPELKSDG